MINNATFLVTNRCNSKCINCNIWKQQFHDELSVSEIVQLFSLQEFGNLIELGISGGEPFIRDDIIDVIEAILLTRKSIDTIFITTNASFEWKVIKSLRVIEKYVNNINLGVSIDGTESTNEKVRGYNSYPNACELLSKVGRDFKKIKTSISLTISNINCNPHDLYHIKQLSENLKCDYSFRLASTNDSYYKNTDKNFVLNDFMKFTLIEFILKNKLDDRFMAEQLYYLITGKIPIMYNYTTHELLCAAGKSFVFIHPNGVIYPCINSTTPIGDYIKGISGNPVSNIANCPCMTECTIWPMLTRNISSPMFLSK